MAKRSDKLYDQMKKENKQKITITTQAKEGITKSES